MKCSKTLFVIASLLMFLNSGSVIALNSGKNVNSKQQEIKFNDSTTVTSGKLDFSMKTSVLVFRENVKAINSQYTLSCDILRVLPDKDNNPESMEAEENVILKAKEGKATCRKVNYSRSSGQFILEHDATLHHAKGSLSADKIIVMIKDGQFDGIHCEGNVKGTIPFNEGLTDKKNTNSN